MKDRRGAWQRVVVVLVLVAGIAAGTVLAAWGDLLVARWTGAGFGTACALLLLTLPRSPAAPPPAVAVDGGVAVPIRRLFAPALAGAVLLAGLACFGAPVVVREELGTRAGFLVPALAWVAGPGLLVLGGLLLIGALRNRARLVLSPDGVSYLPLTARTRQLDWRDIDTVDLDEVWEASLVINPRLGPGGGSVARAMKVPLHAVTWPGPAVADAIRWYAGPAGARRDLTDPAGLERWRGR